MKNKDKLIRGNKKEPKNFKEIVPSIYKEIRSNNQIKNPDNFMKYPQRNFVSPIQPVKLFPEWPCNDVIKNFNFFKEIDEIYSDPDHYKIYLPLSFLQDCSYQIQWIRLYDIYLDNILTKEIIMKYPFKNMKKIKKFLINSYNEDKCPIKFKIFENSDEFNINYIESNISYDSGNKKLFKHFFKFFELSNIKIVNSFERKETPEEVILRVELEEKSFLNEWKIKIEKEEQISIQNSAMKKNVKQKSQNNEIKPPAFDIIREPKIKREIDSKNISMIEKYSDFSKWVGSVLQNIKDLNITDLFDPCESIWKKIYPQKEGIPVFNPKGLYWVKLYYMGKPRKIIIDDRIPCNKTGESLLPKTENSDELWPAILTKALLKLFSYKFKSLNYPEEEIGDLHIIYALTGYLPENINFNSLLTRKNNNIYDKNLEYTKENEIDLLKVKDKIKSKISYYLSDKNFFNKKHFVMIYNHIPLSEIFNLEKPVYNHSPKSKNKAGNTRKVLMMESKTNDFKKFARTNTPKHLKIDEFENDENLFKPKLKESKKNSFLKIINMDKPSLISINDINLKTQYQHLNSNKGSLIPSKKINFFQKFLQKRKEESNELSEVHLKKNQNELHKRIQETESDIGAFNEIQNIISKNASKNLDFLIHNRDEKYMSSLKNSFINEHNMNIENSNTNNQINYNQKFSDTDLNSSTKNINNQESVGDFKNVKTENIKKKNFSKITGKNRQTILNLFRVEKSDSMFYKKPSIILNNQLESQMVNNNRETIIKDNEKLDSKILIDCLYPILDFFDTINFNLKRIKPLEMDDLKKKILEKKICYKQLSREDKKLYINSIMDLKTKQKEFKNKKIEELKKDGNPHFCIKILNNFYGVEKLKFYNQFSQQDIFMVKKCLLNNWEFPPYDFLEKLTPTQNIEITNKDINEESLTHTELTPIRIKDKDTGQNFFNSNNNFENLNLNNHKYNNHNLNQENLNNLGKFKNKINNQNGESKITSKTNLATFNKANPRASILNSNTVENLVRSQSPNVSLTSTDNKCNSNKSPIWPKDLYLGLINNNFSQYENAKEPLERDTNHINDWINFEDFYKNFNNMIILHSTKAFNEIKEIDCNWYNSEFDLYKSQDDCKVIYISTKNIGSISNRIEEKEKNDFLTNNNNLFTNFSKNNVSSLSFYNNQKFNENNFFINKKNEYFNINTLKFLIEYTTNFEINGYFKDFNFYIILDLYKIKKCEIKSKENSNLNSNSNVQKDNLELILIKENIIMKGFYSTINISELNIDEEYLLFIKGGLNPLGYHLKLYLEKGTFEFMNYSKYLQQYEKYFNIFNCKVEIPNCLPNSPYLLMKLKAKITTNKLRIKFDFNIKDIYLSQFLDLYIIKNKENKYQDFKKIIFSEIILLEFDNIFDNKLEESLIDQKQCEILNETHFIIILNAPFFVHETAIELDIITDSPGNIYIEHIENIPPFEIKDSLVVSRDNIIFKELIFSPEKVNTTLIIEVKRSKKKFNQNNLHQNIHYSNHKYDTHNTSNHNLSKYISDNNEEENKTLLFSSDYDLLKEKERLRLNFEVTYQNKLIYKTDFLESILIPNIIFEGISIMPVIEIKENKKTGKNLNTAEKEKKQAIEQADSHHIDSIKDKENIPYLIKCTLDVSEAPSWIKTEEIEWIIRVYSSETLAFVKDTSKEQFEKSLKDSWELNDPGRSLKARTTRFKYIIDQKLANNEILNREEAKYLEYFRFADGNIAKIPLFQNEDRLKLLNPLEINLNTEVEINNNNLNNFKITDKGIKNDNNKNNTSTTKKKQEDKKKGNNNNENFNNTKDQSYINNIIQNNNTVNNTFLNTNESIVNINVKEENQNIKNGTNKNFKGNNLNIHPNQYVDDWNFFKNLTSKRLVIENTNNLKSPLSQSNFIKDFIKYVNEDRTKIVNNNILKQKNENHNLASNN